MSDIVTFALSLVGFALLLVAIPRHQQDWLRRKLPPRKSRVLRLAGFVLLAAAFVVAGSASGWGYGAVLWFGWLTVAAALVVTAQANREAILTRVRR
ncbi:MAG: DUF3325 domain-containing protein [Sphingobium sp.]